MHGTVPPAANDRAVSNSAFRLLMQLPALADEAGRVELSQIAMAREVGMAVGTVDKSLGNLVEAGWLERYEARSPTSPSRYVIAAPLGAAQCAA